MISLSSSSSEVSEVLGSLTLFEHLHMQLTIGQNALGKVLDSNQFLLSSSRNEAVMGHTFSFTRIWCFCFFILSSGWWLYNSKYNWALNCLPVASGLWVFCPSWENCYDCWAHWLHLLSCWGKHFSTVSSIQSCLKLLFCTLPFSPDFLFYTFDIWVSFCLKKMTLPT